MSSADKIKVTYIKEVTPGVTPTTGNFTPLRLNSESLSGDPKTVESSEINGSGQPMGQIVTGVDIKGSVPVTLSPTKSHQDFIEAGLYSTWGGTITTGAANLTIDAAAKTLTRSTGSFVTDGFKVGDFVQLTGFTNADNNTVVYVAALTATVMTFVAFAKVVNESGSGDEIAVRPNYVEYGNTQSTFSVEKLFTDLTDKSIIYRRVSVGKLTFDVKFGELANFSVDFNGCDVDTPVTPVTDGRTISAVATEQALAAQNVGVFIVDGEDPGYCVQNIKLDVDLKIKPIECIGHIAPSSHQSTGLSVGVNFDVYLNDTSFDFHKTKLEQTPIDVAFYIKNADGGFAFRVPAVQLSFPDASAKGRGELNMLAGAGFAKYDATMNNTIRIYKLA